MLVTNRLPPRHVLGRLTSAFLPVPAMKDAVLLLYKKKQWDSNPYPAQLSSTYLSTYLF
jgi:hypothetical protein